MALQFRREPEQAEIKMKYGVQRYGRIARKLKHSNKFKIYQVALMSKVYSIENQIKCVEEAMS